MSSIRKATVLILSIAMIILCAPSLYMDIDAAMVSLSVNGHSLSSTDQTTGWNSTAKTGWKYILDTSTQKDYLAISGGSDGQDISSIIGQGNLELACAGLNHIESLNITGDLNMYGSGIVMIDSLYVTGSVNAGATSLFIRDSADKNKYILYTQGTLDESYVLPAGKTFVVPSGTSLDLTVGYYPPATSTGTGTWSAGRLTIPSSTVLTVESGGSIHAYGDYANAGKPNTSKVDSMISVYGTMNLEQGSSLTLESQIKVLAGGILNSQSSIIGTVTNITNRQDTSITNVTCNGMIIFDGTVGRSSIMGTDIVVEALPACAGVDLGTMNLSGNSSLILIAGSSPTTATSIKFIVDSITASGQLLVRGSSGGQSEVNSGITSHYYPSELIVNGALKGGTSLNINNGIVNANGGISADTINIGAGTIVNSASVKGTVASTSSGILNQGSSTFSPNTGSLQYFEEFMSVSGYIRYDAPFGTVDDSLLGPFTISNPQNGINYQSLLNNLTTSRTKLSSTTTDYNLIGFEIIGVENGSLKAWFIDSNSTENFSLSNINSISAIYTNVIKDTAGGGSQADVSTNNTGSGILGGDTSGTLNGENNQKKVAGLGGNGQSTPTPASTTEPPVSTPTPTAKTTSTPASTAASATSEPEITPAATAATATHRSTGEISPSPDKGSSVSTATPKPSASSISAATPTPTATPTATPAASQNSGFLSCPFLIPIIIAIIAFLFFLIFKRRKNDDEDDENNNV